MEDTKGNPVLAAIFGLISVPVAMLVIRNVAKLGLGFIPGLALCLAIMLALASFGYEIVKD